MRRSQRLAGQMPEDAADIAKLIAIRNSRRGLLGRITRLANQILVYLNEGDTDNALATHNNLIEIYVKFRAANTEYVSYETDPRKIQDCNEAERIEAHRIAELERMIRSNRKTPSLPEDNSPEASFFNVNPSDSASQSSGRSCNSSTDAPVYHSSPGQVRFSPRPPSVSSLTAKPTYQSSFRRIRRTSLTDDFSNLSTHSSRTMVMENPSSSRPPKASHVFRPVDQFIDELVEGEETCLAGLSNPLTASSALRYEFENKNLPTIELVKFSGDSSKWPEFVENFCRRVHQKLSFTDNDRMERLISVLTGDAKKSVECIGTSGIFYAIALKTLKRDFGNKTVVTHAKLKNLLDKPQLPSNDRAALKRFHQHLKSTVTWLKMIGNIGAIHSTENLSRAVMRLPNELRKNFYRSSKDLDDARMTLFKLESWLDGKLKELFNPIANIIAQEEGKDKGKSNIKKGFMNHMENDSDSRTTPVTCHLCKKPHRLYQCEKFKGKPVAERRTDVKDLKLCFNCLSNLHTVKDCRSKVSCKECRRRHHTLLHDASYSKEKSSEKGETKQSHHGRISKKTYLQILPVTVSNGNVSVKVNALLDPGSDTTLISANLVDQLELQGTTQKLSITNVLTKKKVMNSKSVSFVLSSKESEIRVDNAWVVDSLNIKRKAYDLPALKQYKHLEQIPLETLDNKEVDLLIGADVPEALLHLEFVKGKNPAEPMAVRTLLGWTLFGGRSITNNIQANLISLNTLDEKLERFWNEESYGTTPNPEIMLTREEKRALLLLKNNTRLVGERFEVGLLWREDDIHLLNNRPLAVTRLLSTERRLEKVPEIKKIYHSKIAEYVKLGHVRKLTKSEAAQTSQITNYIPHHFVLEPNKASKIRIVWDASAKYKGTSLNDNLLKGPDLLNSLVTVLSKFRRGKVAVMSDVEKMFHQILVPTQDRDSLRFLWRDSQSDEISEYQFLVHPFGKKDSPCAANWALKNCADAIDNVSETETFSELTQEEQDAVTKAIKEEFYMDDFCSSFDSTQEARDTCSNVKQVTKERRFRLTKWISNDPDFLKTIPKEDLSPKITCQDFKRLPNDKTLGVRWNPTEDVFFFNIPVRNCKETKRGLLSFLCSIFDPLGFLAPYLLAPKLILQTLWKEKVGWDDPLPRDILMKFLEWQRSLSSLEEISIPRWYKFNKVTDMGIELHIFSDASMKAFSAVAYFRTNRNEGAQCSFIIGKSRLAPIKGSTTPRLELQAAVLASRIKDCVTVEMSLPNDKTFMWTDSKVTLSYIRNENRTFSSYVMNRTNEIREKTDVSEWRFVPGKLNVADIGTKCFGIDETKTWIEGPEFLKESSIRQFEEPEDDEEAMEIVTAHVEVKRDEMTGIISWERFSSWTKIRRCYAWILKLKKRWVEVKRNGKSSIDTSFLDVEDIEAATQELCRISQVESKLSLDERRLSSLKPIELKDLLCVGGRIAKCDVPNQSKHQVILSNKHPISDLIIRHTHETHHHFGRNATLSHIRERYWIVKGRSKVKKMLKDCFVCKRETIKTKHPIMADLPKERVDVGSHTFENVGVDYFGPIFVKQNRKTRRTSGQAKRYGCVFTCMTTRALHLELAGDLSTDSFILALRRFRARRGNPRLIRSDNGTNFVGAEREIREALSRWDQNKIRKELSNYNIEWKFNPPLAPWMGGAMEAMVKLTKKALRSTIKERVLTEEALHTFLLEVESTINSRPITPLSDDINDFEALTPNHFLLGRPSLNIPIVEETQYNLRSKWQKVQSCFDLFWKRWIKEYLPTITERAKWRHPIRNIKEGDLVVVGEKDVPRYRWPLARVVTVVTSDDGVTRIAKIKTSNGSIYTRPTGSLGLLEEEASHQ